MMRIHFNHRGEIKIPSSPVTTHVPNSTCGNDRSIFVRDVTVLVGVKLVKYASL